VNELKRELDANKLVSSNFHKIHQLIIDTMCDKQYNWVDYTGDFTKSDIEYLKHLLFKVEVVKTHGILGSGKAEKLRISWE
jgi:hypothetical protein